MLPPIAERLAAWPAAVALLGDDPIRVWRHGRVPRSAVLPYVTWQVVVGTPENQMSDKPGIDRITVQLDCWHETDTGVEALALAVQEGLERYAHCTGIPIDSRDAETNNYRVALQFDYWWTREPVSL